VPVVEQRELVRELRAAPGRARLTECATGRKEGRERGREGGRRLAKHRIHDGDVLRIKALHDDFRGLWVHRGICTTQQHVDVMHQGGTRYCEADAQFRMKPSMGAVALLTGSTPNICWAARRRHRRHNEERRESREVERG
jgi:hypothetical protein